MRQLVSLFRIKKIYENFNEFVYNAFISKPIFRGIRTRTISNFEWAIVPI